MIELKDIRKKFSVGTPAEVTALDGITLSVTHGEFVVLLGSNGSGKSTLMNVIAGSEKPDGGSIAIDGKEVTSTSDYERSRYVARIFQQPTAGTAADLSLLENFRLAALRTTGKGLRIGTGKAFRETVKSKVATLGMGLENKLDQEMGTFSGGQRQALTLLMAVMDRTKVLLMDEPAAALDPRTSKRIMALADQLVHEHGLTAFLITHDMKDALNYGDRVLFLSEGKIREDISGLERKKLDASRLLGWFGV